MNEESLFAAALERDNPADRAALLEKECAGDAALRQRIEALLRSHEQTDFLQTPAVQQAAAEILATQVDPPDLDGGAAERNSPGDEDHEALLGILSPSDAPGSLGRLGHYEVQEEIGRGGMGVVLRAWDERLHRVVAIKVMARHLASSATARRRFIREAQAAAAISHDHIVTIHAVEEIDALPYIAMQYVDGQSLSERIERDGPLEVREILRIGTQTAAGLEAAHRQGVIHRDIKPANILLENGVERVKITDFGLARAAADAHLTQTGVVVGTPWYMAPEQARGEHLDHRADLFSLGSVLYAACTGRAPFRASGTMAVLKRVCEDAPRPIREINPDIPDYLVAIIEKLLAKNPAERYQSAAEVAELLGKHLAHVQHPSVVPMPMAKKPPATPHKHFRRRWAVAAAAILILLVLGISLSEATGVTRVTEFVATVLRIRTPDGVLVVEVDDPRVQVTIEGDGGLVITGTGAQEVRLRPGSYQLHATKDGEPVPLDRDVVTITRGDKQLVSVRLEGAGASDAGISQVSTAERGAFVLLGGQGVAERKFDTLAEAVQRASDGDTIEIRGDGPFDTSAITIRRPLVIRAGTGYRPVIRLRAGETGHVLLSSAPLVLEGLEIRYRMDQFTGELLERDVLQRDGVVKCDGAYLAIANCRLIGDGKRSIVQSWPSPSARVVNSELLNSAWDAISWNCNSPARLTMDNCIVAAPGAGTLVGSQSNKDANEYSISISRCTSLTGWHTLGIRRKWALAASQEREIPDTPPISIELVANVLDAPMPVVSILPLDAFVTETFDLSRDERNLLLPKLFGWHEEYNLYRGGNDFCSWLVKKPAGGESRTGATREEWTSLFQLGDTHSKHGQPRFQGGDLRARLAADPLSLSPDDFRLKPDSPGYRAGSDGMDLGADVDLVGPGEAYERWKKTPEYQQWLEETGQLTDRSAAIAEPGAFVLLGGEGVAERKLDTLAEAVQRASDDDTIEIRGNGPWFVRPIPLGKRSLNVRAAKGFRPVIKLRRAKNEEDLPLFWGEALLSLEGIEFQSEAPPKTIPGGAYLSAPQSLYLANCRFVLPDYICVWTQPWTQRCAFTNCEFHVPTIVAGHNPPDAEWALDNCVKAGGNWCGINPIDLRLNSHSIRMSRCTSAGSVHLVNLAELPILQEENTSGTKPLQVFVSASVLEHAAPLGVNQGEQSLAGGEPLSPEQLDALLKRLIEWRGQKNLHHAAADRWIQVGLSGTWVAQVGPHDLATWREYWDSPDTDSVEGKSRFQGGDLAARMQSGIDTLTPEDFRLRPDSAGYRAGPDGKDLGADVDLVGPGEAYERWKETPEYQQWLKETGQLTDRAAAITEPGAFVLLGGEGVAERKFDTLANAILNSSDGDTIEIRGNGPFISQPINIGNQALTIRAGKGFRPVLRLSLEGLTSEAALLWAHGPLVLEGLEFERTGQERLPGDEPRAVRIEYGVPVHIANCRFLMPDTIHVIASDSTELRNCEFLGGHAVMYVLPTEGELIVDNCVQVGAIVNLQNFPTDAEKVTVRLSRNTVLADRPFYVSLNRLPKVVIDRAIDVAAIGNVFIGQSEVFFLNQTRLLDPAILSEPDEAEAFVARYFAWQGERNLYPDGAQLLGCDDGRILLTPTRDFKSLETWKQFWASPEVGSLQGRPRFRGGDLLAKLALRPEQWTLDDFRLRPDSPGYRAGPDGKDLGADIDLVGPGAAYERWKQTPEYQEWLKETGQLTDRAAAIAEPGAFVLLRGEGVDERKFDTLAESVQRAADGDTIEIRGNGPFVIEPVTVNAPLVIRAGSGSRPVLALGRGTLDGLTTQAPLVLEGLELISADTAILQGAATPALVRVTKSAPLFLSHCRLVTMGSGRAVYGSPAHCEIRHCEFLRKNDVSNQVVGGWSGGPAHRLIVEDCAIAGNFLGVDLPRDGDVLESSSIRLARNTFVGGWPIALWRWNDGEPGEAPLALDVADNVVTGGRYLFLAEREDGSKLDAAAARAFVKRLLSYQERDNLFESGTQFLTYFRPRPLPEKPDTVALVADEGTWQQFFAQGTSNTQSGTVRFEGGALNARVNQDPQRVTAADFRLRPDSAGYRAGPDGKDLGADVDLVGPGAAYERWKQTPEYQEWLQETGQLRAEAAQASDEAKAPQAEEP